MNDNTKIKFYKRGRFEIKSKYWDGEFRTSDKGGKRDYANCELYYCELYEKEEIVPTDRDSSISVKVTYYYESDKSKIEFWGSWRKWYFTKGTSRDLNFLQTIDFLNQISILLGCTFKDILKAQFVKVELGNSFKGTNLLNGFADGCVNYKNFRKIYRYEEESVKWACGTHSIIVYNKYLEIMNKQICKPYLAKKIRKNNSCIRREIQIEEPSKAPKKLKQYLTTVANFLNHWDDCLESLDAIFSEIDFVPYVLPTGLKHLKGRQKSEFNVFKTFIVASALGSVENYLIVLSELDSQNRRKYIKQECEILKNPPNYILKLIGDCNSIEDEYRVANRKAFARLRQTNLSANYKKV